MNVLFLTHWYPTSDSPISGIFIREHARAISQYHKVYIVHIEGIQRTHQPAPPIIRQIDENLHLIKISYLKPKIYKTAWIQRLRLGMEVVNQLIAEDSSPHIIHANVYNTADIAAILSKKYSIPAVLTEHSSSFPRRLIRGVNAITVPFFINQLQMVLPVSKNLIEHMRYYGVRGPFQVIPNTVNCDVFYPAIKKTNHSDGIRRILAVASLVRIKRIDFLLQASCILTKWSLPFHLSIIGDGPERQSLEEMVHHLKLGNQISFLGLKTKPEVADYMRHSDILALTSDWENQPVVILEALASGLPVIASRVGGISEILPPEYGRLVEPGNIHSIAEEIAYLINHLQDFSRSAIVQYAREKFSYSSIGKAFSEVYEKVINDFRK